MKFIFTADWHLRPDTPRCRRDEDWVLTQTLQIRFVMQQATKHNVPVVIGGDLVHKPQIPDSLKSMLIKEFIGVKVYAIGGNHCFPWHSYENIDNSSFGVLLNSGIISSPDFGSYADFGRPVIQSSADSILFLHEPIFATEKDCPPNMKAKTAVQVFDEHPDMKWILCGDIHKGFHVKKQGRHLIMAGCLNRQASNFKDYEPKIWLIDTDKDVIEEILVPDDVLMVSDEHIQKQLDREDRIEAFVSLIREAKGITLDFEHNVREALKESEDINEDVKEVVEELMNE